MDNPEITLMQHHKIPSNRGYNINSTYNYSGFPTNNNPSLYKNRNSEYVNKEIGDRVLYDYSRRYRDSNQDDWYRGRIDRFVYLHMRDSTPITLISGFKRTYTQQKFKIVGFEENKHIILEAI